MAGLRALSPDSCRQATKRRAESVSSQGGQAGPPTKLPQSQIRFQPGAGHQTAIGTGGDCQRPDKGPPDRLRDFCAPANGARTYCYPAALSDACRPNLAGGLPAPLCCCWRAEHRNHGPEAPQSRSPRGTQGTSWNQVPRAQSDLANAAEVSKSCALSAPTGWNAMLRSCSALPAPPCLKLALRQPWVRLRLQIDSG